MVERAPRGVGRRRSRSLTCAALGAVVSLGLLSRRFPLPGLLAEHTGDGLYAAACFCALAVVSPASRASKLAWAAFAWSAAVELSQLLSWPWLLSLRSTRVGALLLGQGFQVADLVAYAVGATAAFGLDGLARRLGPGRGEVF